MQYTRIVLTLNNYSEEERTDLLGSEFFSYIVLGKEEVSCPHLQGYAEFKKKMGKGGIKKKINKRMHFERAYAQDPSKYCKKDGDWEERGEKKKPGRRTDIEELKQRTREGESFLILAHECPNYQILRFIERLCSLRQPDLIFRKPKVTWVYGDTGVGKTRMAVEACIGNPTWIGLTGQWFDNYYGQIHVILDDLRAKNWSYERLLLVTDGYQRSLPVKGSFTLFGPQVIWITAPLSPEGTYAARLQYYGSIGQLLRRIDEVIHLSPDVDYPVFKDGNPVGCTVVPPL